MHRLHRCAHLAVAPHDAKSERDLRIRDQGQHELDPELVAVANRRPIVRFGMTQRCSELTVTEHDWKGEADLCQKAFVGEMRVVEDPGKEHDAGSIDVLKSNIDRDLEKRWPRFEELLAVEELHGRAEGYPDSCVASTRLPPCRRAP